LPDAVAAAAAAGFDAVECHWPYDVPAPALAGALAGADMALVALNTRPGDRRAGEFGLSAVPGRGADARAAVHEALDYARTVGAGAVHVMAGVAGGSAAADAFAATLADATAKAARDGIIILIEPLNPHDVPGYFLTTTDHARQVIDAVGAPNLKLMFDCYHVQRTEGDVAGRLEALHDVIGHIQFAGVPDRGPPDGGTLDYAPGFAQLSRMGWRAPLGAEYHPRGPTEATLGWMRGLG